MCIIGIHGIEVSVPSTRNFKQTSWVLISTGKNRFVNQMEDPSISHNVPSSNLLREQANSKEEESSDDDERSFRRRIGISDPSSSSSKMEKNHVLLKKNPMCRAKTYYLREDLKDHSKKS